MIAKTSLIILSLLTIIVQTGCSESPVKSTEQSFIVKKSLNDTHNAIIDYFIFRNYRVDVNASTHIETFLPDRRTEAQYGDWGNRVHVWLETIEATKTLVQVDVTSQGAIWNSNNDAKVINSLERYLKSRAKGK